VRVVFDTNILVAAFVTEGICARLLRRARLRQFLLFTCPFLLEEFEQVLTGKIHATRKELLDAVQIISEAAHAAIETVNPIEGVCRDKDDDNVLACAKAAKADYLVTGDTDLLELKEIDGISILSPRDFELFFAD
jgi:putative PIN family toxin of toxin-antitoxin system